MTNLDSILKSRNITLPIRVHIVKAMVFPVILYGCESWTIKKAEHLKIRDTILPTKVCLVKAMVFPVVMYGCESWTIKEAEHQRTDAFELWCWRRLLGVC